MANPATPAPQSGETWRHNRTGGLYYINGPVFNTVTDQIDLVYTPLSGAGHQLFSRQLADHPKAFLSTNEQGQPRFELVDMAP